MECLLGDLDLLQGRHNGALRIEGCEVDDGRVGHCDCTIFNGCLACEDFLLSRRVFGLLREGRFNFLLYGLHISDVKDFSVPFTHGGLECAKLLIMSMPQMKDLIDR